VGRKTLTQSPKIDCTTSTWWHYCISLYAIVQCDLL